MKLNLKKMALAVMLFASAGVMAQTFGVRAGYVNSKETGADDVSGIQIGPVGEMGLSNKMLGIQYGVLYTYLGSTYPGVVGTNHYTGHYVDVPVHLKIGFPVQPDITLFAFAGPQLNFGLAQNVENRTVVFGSEVITNVDRYKADVDDDGVYDLNRFDLQLGLGAGLQFKNIQLQVGYDWGMFDLNKRENTEWKRNQLTASVIYGF